MAVFSIDEIDLPVARPFLHRLLALDGRVDVVMHLVPDEPMNSVFARKRARRAVAVLGYAAQEIIGNADVERAVVPVCEQVDEISA